MATNIIIKATINQLDLLFCASKLTLLMSKEGPVSDFLFLDNSLFSTATFITPLSNIDMVNNFGCLRGSNILKLEVNFNF